MINWRQLYSKIPSARILVAFTVTPQDVVNQLCSWAQYTAVSSDDDWLPELSPRRIEEITRTQYRDRGSLGLEDGWADEISPEDRDAIVAWARHSVRTAWPQWSHVVTG